MTPSSRSWDPAVDEDPKVAKKLQLLMGYMGEQQEVADAALSELVTVQPKGA
jgi:hypothetical protein